MRGLIYKDVQLFFRSIDKKLILIAAVAIALLLTKAGVYGGLMGSIMLAMTVSMQNIMTFATDEKVDWKKYQKALPISNISVIASKYLSVLITLVVSVFGSVVFSLASCLIHAEFDVMLLGLSVMSAIIVPLIWTGICLPLTFWFGFRSAQTMGLIVVIPIFYMIKFFEDGPGLSVLPASISTYLLWICIAAVVIFLLSIAISLWGYSKK
ncbi:ABC-2 transporter permease [Catenibacillus scindens]|mgnify:FL=1|uniref:ABC-2 transporter permease n=1 Tax=Catenibacillus scindens TaxID=673271 RepID=UPI00320A4227